MNARWYDPVVQRFLSADAIVPNPGNSQAYNRYTYVFNNPLIYVDPNGHDPEFDAGPSADFTAAGEQGIVEFIAYLLENEQDNPYWLIFLHYFGGYENDRQGYINSGQADQGFSMASGFLLALDSVSQIEI